MISDDVSVVIIGLKFILGEKILLDNELYNLFHRLGKDILIDQIFTKFLGHFWQTLANFGKLWQTLFLANSKKKSNFCHLYNKL